MRLNFKDKQGFFTLLGLLLAVALIFFLCYLVLKIYFGNPTVDKRTQEPPSEQQDIGILNYPRVLDSTRNKVKGIEQQVLDREKQLQKNY